jgi:hypothetical protein
MKGASKCTATLKRRNPDELSARSAKSQLRFCRSLGGIRDLLEMKIGEISYF